MKLGNHLNGSYFELQNVRLQNLAVDPTFNASYTGLIYYRGAKVHFNNGVNHVTLRDTGTQLVNGDIATNAAIDLSKLAVNPLARANHTGTQTASTISDFNAAAASALSGSLATKVDKVATNFRIYATDGAGVQTTLAYGTTATTGAVVQRDGSGRAKVVDGAAADDIATRGQLDAASTADRNRANHTGTQTASTISDFNTAVNSAIDLSGKVDKSSASNLQVYVKNGSGVVTGVGYTVLATGSTIPIRESDGNIQVSATPTNSSHAASKAYVDSAVAGVRPRPSVSAASTGNVSLSGYPIIDGVQSNQGMRFLLKDQTNPVQNGIYETTASGTLVRAPDADSWYELVSAYVFVQKGDTWADTGWVCTADDDGSTIDVDPINWVQFSAAGEINAGSGLQKVGDTISIASLGVANGMLANGSVDAAKLAVGAVDLGTNKATGVLPITKGGTGGTTAATARTALGAVGKYSSSTHAAGTTISIPASTHGLGATMALDVITRIAATGERVYADDTVAANGDVTVTFGVSQAANTILVIIQG